MKPSKMVTSGFLVPETTAGFSVIMLVNCSKPPFTQQDAAFGDRRILRALGAQIITTRPGLGLTGLYHSEEMTFRAG